ncbi:MAG: PilN domain-containing protein [Woeseia sp.]
MAELDLIPHDYRVWLSQQSLLRRFGAGIAATVVALLLGSGWLQYSTAAAGKQLQQLKSQNAITEQQQLQLAQLKDQQTQFEQQLSLLHGLRAGAAIEDIFSIIDRSLPGGELWFLEWSFRRAGVIVNGEQRGIETGYFIIVADNGEPAANQDLKVATQMTIHGQARDHQALSTFVRTLFQQQNIRDVNVQKTSQARYANRRVVDFVVTVELNSSLQDS